MWNWCVTSAEHKRKFTIMWLYVLHMFCINKTSQFHHNIILSTSFIITCLWENSNTFSAYFFLVHSKHMFTYWQQKKCFYTFKLILIIWLLLMQWTHWSSTIIIISIYNAYMLHMLITRKTLFKTIIWIEFQHVSWTKHIQYVCWTQMQINKLWFLMMLVICFLF